MLKCLAKNLQITEIENRKSAARAKVVISDFTGIASWKWEAWGSTRDLAGKERPPN